MTRKDFHFNFNEDADPVEELHRLRVATTKHFKTLDAIMEYHRTAPSIEEVKARLEAEIAKKQTRPIASPAPKASQKPAKRRKPAKRLTHA